MQRSGGGTSDTRLQKEKQKKYYGDTHGKCKDSSNYRSEEPVLEMCDDKRCVTGKSKGHTCKSNKISTASSLTLSLCYFTFFSSLLSLLISLSFCLSALYIFPCDINSDLNTKQNHAQTQIKHKLTSPLWCSVSFGIFKLSIVSFKKVRIVQQMFM